MGSNFKKMARGQLERHIRSVAKDSARVIFTYHAQKQMKARQVLDAEVFHVLRTGSIRIDPEEDLKTGHLVCRMECHAASRTLAVCTALDDDDPDLIVVTVIPK